MFSTTKKTNATPCAQSDGKTGHAGPIEANNRLPHAPQRARAARAHADFAGRATCPAPSAGERNILNVDLENPQSGG